MTDELRIKLDTKIEREVHKLVQNISENVLDRLNIYVRRNESPIDMDVFDALMKTMQASITEFEMNGIDQFHRNIKQELDAYVGEENPTEQSAAVDGGTTSKKRVKPVALSV